MELKNNNIFLEGTVDHIIYRYYIVNRRSFIYCSLAYSKGERDYQVARLCRCGENGAKFSPLLFPEVVYFKARLFSELRN